MKVRQTRIHLMGTSNREANGTQGSNLFKTQSVFDRSYNKSKSLYTKFASSSTIENTESVKYRKGDPLGGFHHQFETQRFDKNNIKPYKQAKMVLPQQKLAITFAMNLNSDIKSIKQEFKGKRINMHKLHQLKTAFVTNNRNRRDLHSYYQKYANNGVIDQKALKNIVKQYGYDINEDEAKLIFKLTHHSNKSDKFQDHLRMDGFIQLMTKDNIFYKTLKFNEQNSQSQSLITFQKNFSEKIHQVLRNKFVNLKEALNIYVKRNEDVGQKQFQYVMKKLDITNLILSDQEKKNIFQQYKNEEGKLNVQGLICAIAQQQHGNRTSKIPYNQMLKDLQVDQEVQFKKNRKIRNFSLNGLSNLQYQKQLSKAINVVEQLKHIKNKKLKNNEQSDIFKNFIPHKIASRTQVAENTQKLLKNQGINFHKEDYQAFAAYLNYDANGYISLNKLNQFVFNESECQARDRLERRIRKEAPQIRSNHKDDQYVDRAAAIKSIRQIKDLKMNPEARQMFKFFDKDQDGFISEDQFKCRVKQMKIMENWEIQNLVAHLQLDKEGSINFQNFAKRIDEEQLKSEMPIIKTKSSKSNGDWLATTKLKKTFVQEANQLGNQKATRHSAWPTYVYEQDLSLIQAPRNSGIYVSEAERFGQRKQDYGIKQKMIVQSIADNRVKKMTQWNKVLQQRAEINRERQEEKAAAKNYSLRLAQQKYELQCHL